MRSRRCRSYAETIRLERELARTPCRTTASSVPARQRPCRAPARPRGRCPLGAARDPWGPRSARPARGRKPGRSGSPCPQPRPPGGRPPPRGALPPAGAPRLQRSFWLEVLVRQGSRAGSAAGGARGRRGGPRQTSSSTNECYRLIFFCGFCESSVFAFFVLFAVVSSCPAASRSRVFLQNFVRSLPLPSLSAGTGACRGRASCRAGPARRGSSSPPAWRPS